MNTSIKNSVSLILITNPPKHKMTKPAKRRAPKRIGKPQKRRQLSNGIFGVM